MLAQEMKSLADTINTELTTEQIELIKLHIKQRAESGDYNLIYHKGTFRIEILDYLKSEGFELIVNSGFNADGVLHIKWS